MSSSKFSMKQIEYWMGSVRDIIGIKRRELRVDNKAENGGLSNERVLEMAKEQVAKEIGGDELLLLYRRLKQAQQNAVDARKKEDAVEDEFAAFLSGKSHRRVQNYYQFDSGFSSEIEEARSKILGHTVLGTKLAELDKLEKDALQALRLARGQEDIRKVYLFVANKVGIYNEVAEATVLKDGATPAA